MGSPRETRQAQPAQTPPKPPTLPPFTLTLKPCWSEHVVVDKNHARQLLIAKEGVQVPRDSDEPTLTLLGGAQTQIVRTADSNGRPVLYVPARVHLDAYADASDIEGARWVGLRTISSPTSVLESLRENFQFRVAGNEGGRGGLRTPQVGALHSVLGFWTTDPREPATVVMPTGTGKTETMIALFAHQAMARLLVLVPSDALRTQLSSKFETYGLLQELEIVGRSALRPVVGQLKHGFSKKRSGLAFANACNIVVTTPQALNASSSAVRDFFLDQFSHLFVDEAHHLGAETWKTVRDRFAGGRVVQFTATPFREDGRHLKGRIIYAFPLREAQRQGYFSPIDYIPVLEGPDPDRAIAEAAVARLRQDLHGDLDHLIMARVDRIGRADELAEIYRDLAPDFSPIVVHSRLMVTERSEAMSAITARLSRVVVCVNMLGEGFDLPELKIAAIHDPHKSLGVTLQFVGRFARGQRRLGRAAVLVGRPDAAYDERLRALFREDADWNTVVQTLAEHAVTRERDVDDFEREFSKRSDNLAIQALEPKMSTVVYKTTAKGWRVSGVLAAFKEGDVFGEVSVNTRENVLWFITRHQTQVAWGIAPELSETTYDLYVVYWDQPKALLFIHSSNTESHYGNLAEKVSGAPVELVKGEVVYRAMTGISRLVPTNVGVLDTRSHSRRFSFHVGGDVSEGFPKIEEVTKTQTNIFASGFENGQRVTIGASLKGRIWSHRIARSLRHWMHWCDLVGGKLSDSSRNIDEIMRNFIRPSSVTGRPHLVFLAAEWPWFVLEGNAERLILELDGDECPMVDADLKITVFDRTSAVTFDVVTPNWSLSYEAAFSPRGATYPAKSRDATVKTQRRSWPLSTFLESNGLTFHLENDALLVHPSMVLQPQRDYDPFDQSRIEPLDWKGIDIRKESQGATRDKASIQAKMISHIAADTTWRVILDDDGSGEVADVVALSWSESDAQIFLIHCKYSTTNTPGARLGDLYEVCGQAQKSARWKRDVGLMLDHLIRREKLRGQRARTGFERGDLRALYSLRDDIARLRVTVVIAIAQPGISKSKLALEHLHLLACTEVYLQESYRASLKVFTSA